MPRNWHVHRHSTFSPEAKPSYCPPLHLWGAAALIWGAFAIPIALVCWALGIF